MYPPCLALQAALDRKQMTPAELAQQLRDRFHRKRADKQELNGFYIQGLITGQAYAPDTLRGLVAQILEQTVKSTFPEYLIECHTLRKLRGDMSLSELSAKAGDRAFKTIRNADISAYECGHRYCHADTRAAIAAALDLSVAEVFPEYQAFG
jgi:hypothetical protein